MWPPGLSLKTGAKPCFFSISTVLRVFGIRPSFTPVLNQTSFVPFFSDGVVEIGKMRGLPGGRARSGGRAERGAAAVPGGRSGASSAAERGAGAEDADVGELFETVERHVQRLTAAHRESRNRAMRAIRHHAIVLLRVRHDVGQKIAREVIQRRAAAGVGVVFVWPAGMTTTIGLIFFAAIRLSKMNPARPTDVHASSQSPAPCSR